METKVFVINLDSARNHLKDRKMVLQHAEQFKDIFKKEIDQIKSEGWKIELVVPFGMETHSSMYGPPYSVTSYFVYCTKE